MSSIRWWTSRPVARQLDLTGWFPPVMVACVVFLVALGVTGAAQQPPDAQPAGTPQPSEASDPAPDQAPDGQDDPDGQPVFRSEINFVRVDAIVTDDDDNFVLDLTADDFEILEDDALQQIESFELVEITGEPDPSLPPPSSIRNEYDQEREAARPDSRIFVRFSHAFDLR